MKKLRIFLIMLVSLELGFFAGKALSDALHYRRYPDLYEFQSAPWYTGTVICGIFTALAVLLTLVAYYLSSRLLRKAESNGEEDELCD